MKIAISPFMPEHTHHFFKEVIDLFSVTLKDLGFDVVQSNNRLKKDALNLLIGYQYIPESHIDYVAENYQYILIQLEQLSDTGGWFKQAEKKFDSFRSLFKGASQVWDYAQENIGFLELQGVDSHLIPLGFHKSLVHYTPHETQDIDVLFYGNLYPKRMALLKELEKHCHLHTLFNIFGEERNEALQRAKVIINIHSHEGLDTLEQARLFYLLSNHSFVISESSDWNPYGDALVHYAYEDLHEGVLTWLKKPDDERKEKAHQGFLALQNIPFKDNLKKALMSLQ